ncbi:hypothetical protein GUJ93_ZPchr0012g21615 [Zizania palustris]|uniref:Scarecrow-like protein 6 n=1 Tax=Zizania palustris TaxID=103762 RepID=A0A8J5WS99_ZIZPA|nr:hypothetical protein GUJ93_ZPchr0012g21615 [Zizania palustris]
MSCHPHSTIKSPEPTSVLYNRSPSPPTSSSLGSNKPDPTPPISADDWEAVLSGDMPAPAIQPQDSSFIRWIMDAGYADGDGDAFGFKGPAFAAAADPFDSFSLLPQLPPHQLSSQSQEDLQPQALVDEILEAARRIDAGDSTSAGAILARLNHRLPSPPHPPLLRAVAHLRDALLRLLPPTAFPPESVSSPLDVPLKLAAHKALADVSPTVQFANFTSTQALIDALDGARHVHVVDFDVGFGGHWPPFMQELAQHWRHTAVPLPPPALKVTALVPPGWSHPVELHLTSESLTRFAAELGIPFEFSAIVFDPLSTSPPVGLSAAPDEAVAVHLSAGSGTFSPSPAHLRVVKHLRPAVVVCVDHGCERGDLPLPHHALNLLRSCAALLESLDTTGASPDVVSKIVQFILQPRC